MLKQLHRPGPAKAERLDVFPHVKPIQRVGFSLLYAGRLYARCFQEHSRGLELDLTQCGALLMLAQSEGVTQQRLAELTVIDAAALGRVLDRLEAQEWIERHPRPGDRRARSLVITQKARAHLPLIWEIVQKSQLAALQGPAREEMRLLARALDRVLANPTRRQPGRGLATPLQRRIA
jgi:MarR family transcriptional regulator, transcriptional regulator for hemolysin